MLVRFSQIGGPIGQENGRGCVVMLNYTAWALYIAPLLFPPFCHPRPLSLLDRIEAVSGFFSDIVCRNSPCNFLEYAGKVRIVGETAVDGYVFQRCPRGFVEQLARILDFGISDE